MESRAYAEELAWLYGLEAARGMDFKLERVELALRSLGDPHTRFKSIHIAGTNGKGSVAAMLHAMFSAGGYRVGLYTSPHLVSFTERIRVGAAEISEAEVVRLVREIRTAATVRGIDLTFFEFVTVMAFLHFARQAVDLAVLEVGLGGRLDATNVVDPEVAVITTIGLDHEEFLGHTVEAVAREKAGIIKPGRPVIVGDVSPEVGAVIRGVANANRAPVFSRDRDFAVTPASSFRFSGIGCEIDALHVPLQGSHQHENAATATAAAVLLRRTLPLSDEALRRGLAQVRWPGRLDVVREAPLVVLDGAHNADGVATLVRELPAITQGRAIHLLFAVMRDKLWQPMVDTLGRVARTVTLTTVLPPRGEAPETLARHFAPYCPVRIEPQAVPALEALVGSVNAGDAVLVTGSLFLVGAVYPYFLGRRGRPGLFDPRPTALQP